jgi:uncharacterized protein YjgD (DUF1641 family)
MGTVLAEDRIAELDRKLDFIVEEIANLKRMRNSAEDLLTDLSLVGMSAMKDAVVAPGMSDLHPGEIASLLKTTLANVRPLEAALQQLQSASDFIQDAQPIVRDLMNKAVKASDSLERKGYLNAARAGFRVSDAFVRSHTAEDWMQVEASGPQLIGFLRELTKPEVLQALEAIIHGFGRVQATMDVNKSLFAIARDFNSAEARRGIAILVEFLKVVGASIATAAPGTPICTTKPEEVISWIP